MRIHVIQHVEFENHGHILKWGEEHGHSFSYSLLYQKTYFPQIAEFDFLLIMGGPMNIDEDETYSWLKAEKEFIRASIESDKKVLGICLGAQLIADVLGAKVYKGNEKEIGWFEVKLTKDSRKSKLFQNLPKSFTAFHWHGDTFDIPLDANHMAYSDACLNQAFEYKGRVVGLQFHLEATKAGVKNLLVNCANEILPGKCIQKASEIESITSPISPANKIMEKLMENMIG